MSAENATGLEGALAGATGSPSPDSTGGDAKPALVTEAALTAALEKLGNDTRAQLGRDIKALRDTVTSLVTAAAPKDGDKPKSKDNAGTSSEMDKTLRERVLQLEAREAKQTAKALRLGLRDALVRGGAEPVLAELAVPALLESEKDRFTVGENAMGDSVVSYGEDSVDTWAKLFMEGDLGKRLGTANPAPSLGLPRGSSDNSGKIMREVPYSQASLLSEEELNSGRIRLIQG